MKIKEDMKMDACYPPCSNAASPLVRTAQHWLPRALDLALTLLAWTGFLHLLASGVLGFMQQDSQAPKAGQSLLAVLNSLVIYMILAGVMAASLLTWAKYNQLRARRFERRRRMPEATVEKLSLSFQVHPEILAFIQRQQRLVVHSNAQGHALAFEFPILGGLHPADKPIRLEDLLPPILTLHSTEWKTPAELQA